MPRQGVPARRSRVRLGRPADLEKDPALIPDPATTPVPAELRAEIEAPMALYPDRRSAAIPALHAAQQLHGWCSPEAIEQVACVMRVTPAYLTRSRRSTTCSRTNRSGSHSVYVCTNISCSLRGADALLDAIREAAAGDRSEFNVRAFECLGACDIAPMASVDGVYVGPLSSPTCRSCSRTARAGARCCPRSSSRATRRRPDAQEFPRTRPRRER